MTEDRERRALADPPARVGRRVPRNVYWRGDPLFVAASEALAAEVVEALNAGAALRSDPPGYREGIKAAAKVADKVSNDAPDDAILQYQEGWSDGAEAVVRAICALLPASEKETGRC